MKLKHQVNDRAAKLLICNKCPNGIENSSARGIVPRCLLLERGTSQKAVIVVGVNPGRAKKKETSEISKAKNKNKMVEVTRKYFKKSSYYKKLHKRFENDSVYWTEVIKCQFPKNKPNVCAQFKIAGTCCAKHLLKEIKMVRKSQLFKDAKIWAVGNLSYQVLSLLLPNEDRKKVTHPNARSN